MTGVVLAVLLAMAAPDTRAAGFGDVQVASQLGERLYARVPLVGEGASDVATECIRLIPDSVLQDAPALANARVGIDRRSSPPAVVVTTPVPVAEPAVRFVLEMGCGNRMRREFVLLIDPPDLPSVQIAGTGSVVAPAARVVPGDEPRWGGSIAGDSAPGQSVPSPAYDTPLVSEPPVAAAAPRKVAPKPRPKPVARRPVTAQPQTASVPPPVLRSEAAKPATTDRLVLADADPAAASPPTPEQAARDAREEALTRQVEALTKEVARMRQDMDQLSARNRELINDAETRTGWFAAAGLVIVLAGVGLGFLGRRGEKKRPWRESFAPDGGDADASFAPPPAALPEVREELHEPKAAPAIPVSSYRITTTDTVTDLDITKIDVQESTGHGTIMNTTTAAGTTLFPSDIVGGTTVAASERKTALQSLDFSLDDFDTPLTGARPAPVFAPSKPLTDESAATRDSIFEEIEKAHRAAKKG